MLTSPHFTEHNSALLRSVYASTSTIALLWITSPILHRADCAAQWRIMLIDHIVSSGCVAWSDIRMIVSAVDGKVLCGGSLSVIHTKKDITIVAICVCSPAMSLALLPRSPQNSANHPQALFHKFTFLYVLSMIAVTLPSTFKWWWMDLKKMRPASRRIRASSIVSRRYTRL
ncbi:hypothetical protein BLNAU_978 [Blattamonas nauphoetae]|uniref:Uncharacterized protein n=1 Tax=Blattamonas nauphoetae TaxID=2049346 RepID=A0ABQ9YJG6_9EUKA|nr:hypothetical protein BLNAU_978 [Blattamonas nauphoetae]